MGSIIVRDSNGDTRVLATESPEYEEILKRNIADIPRLIPLDVVTDDDVIHVTIGEEWQAGSGRADIVLLGSDGIITIVETKLKRNPEARREVIAQVLEYGAYLTEWTISEISQRAEDFLRSGSAHKDLRGKSFNEMLGHLLDEDDEPDSFKNKIEQNLREGRIRLIVAVDEMGEQAKKIVTFVNSYSTFDIYLLEITAYSDEGGRQIFVPTLHGYTRKIPPPASTRKEWDWQKFRAELGWTDPEVALAKSLNDRLESISESWGPEYRFRRGWTNFFFGGRKSPFGVTRSKHWGIEIWFRLSAPLDESLPTGTHVRNPKNYVYISGPLEEIPDATLVKYCRAAASQADVDVSAE